jgi:hypothetical protein
MGGQDKVAIDLSIVGNVTYEELNFGCFKWSSFWMCWSSLRVERAEEEYKRTLILYKAEYTQELKITSDDLEVRYFIHAYVSLCPSRPQFLLY